MAESAKADIGHNQGGDIDYAKPVIDRLDQDYAHLLREIEELTIEAGKLPAQILTDEDQGVFDDLIGRMKDKWKNWNGIRETEKRPYLVAERAVDQWFFRLRDRFAEIGGPVTALSDAYTKAKIERERRAREEAARLAREAEDKARREREAAEKAAREAEQAAARKRNAEARAQAEEEARVAREAAEKAAAAEREAMRQTDSAANQAEVKTADLARTRHAGGRMTTAKRVPDCYVTDRAKLDLETLRPYFKPEHLEEAVKAYAKVMNYKAELAGAHIGLKDEVVRR
jgi:hypothetical protein